MLFHFKGQFSHVPTSLHTQ